VGSPGTGLRSASIPVFRVHEHESACGGSPLSSFHGLDPGAAEQARSTGRQHGWGLPDTTLSLNPKP
jgi:hypothetical protein